jgi:hypothetical protein
MSAQSEYIDKITLEFLTNKSHYNKILSINDPKKFEELQNHIKKIEIHSDSIMKITEDYCTDPKKQLTNEMDEAFTYYVKTCIKYLEMKELEGGTDDDTESLFENTTVAEHTIKSYWGQGAKKFGM